MFTFALVEIILLIVGVISITVGVLALVFSWTFYKNSQKINEDTSKNLTKISEKISKIDDIVSNQFNKMFSRIMEMGAEYEGTVPISEIQFIKKAKEIIRKKRKKKIKKK